jgi:plasmid stabilization system protein ParE
LTCSERALVDLERLSVFLAERDPLAAGTTIDLISEAVNILARHPMIGRTVEAGLRELVISRGATGYVALYRFSEAESAVRVLAIRHQCELGFEQIAD